MPIPWPHPGEGFKGKMGEEEGEESEIGVWRLEFAEEKEEDGRWELEDGEEEEESEIGVRSWEFAEDKEDDGRWELEDGRGGREGRRGRGRRGVLECWSIGKRKSK